MILHLLQCEIISRNCPSTRNICKGEEVILTHKIEVYQNVGIDARLIMIRPAQPLLVYVQSLQTETSVLELMKY